MPSSRSSDETSQASGETAELDPRAPRYLEIAEIQASFGVAGEVRARILTDFPKRFARLKQVYLGNEARPVRLERSWLHQGDVILKLAGVDTPEEAAKLRFQSVQVPVSEAVKLRAGAYFHYQIIGLAAETSEGVALGKVTEILSTGGNDVYVVTGPEGEWLVPAIAQVVRSVDLAGGRLVVALMEGMEPKPPAPPKPPKPPRPLKPARPAQALKQGPLVAAPATASGAQASVGAVTQ